MLQQWTIFPNKKNSKLKIIEKSNSWFLVCSGNKLEGNESASPTQSMTVNTPPLVDSQRSNESALTQPELKTSSLALAPNSQGQLNLREEQLPATFNKSPFKVDVYVTVVPKPKTKKTQTQRDE